MLALPGRTFTATIPASPILRDLELGARIEVPVTRAIACYWRPAVRDDDVFTVELEAPDATGSFLIVWMDRAATPTVEMFVPLRVTRAGANLGNGNGNGGDGDGGVDLGAVTPDIDEVAALIRARTKDSSGNELGTFTDDTRPTPEQAQILIDGAVELVLTTVARIGDECVPVARQAAALIAAARIERGYRPEQATGGDSVYQQLMDEAQIALTSLASCAAGDLPGSSQAWALDLVGPLAECLPAGCLR